MHERADPRFCYVVLAHTEAPAALRLARRIRELSPRASVVLRHAQAEDFLPREQVEQAGAFLLHSRLQVSWGRWSLTAAALEALEHARDVTSCDHFVVLSGQDYPLRDLAAWERELVEDGTGASFLHFAPRHQDWRFRWRILRLPAVLGLLPAGLSRQVERAYRATLSRLLSPVVRFYRLGTRGTHWGAAVLRPSALVPGPPVPVACGSFWLTCSRPALDRLLARHHGEPRLAAFFAPTLVPDEHYLQSLLLADPQTVVHDRPTTFQHVPPGDWNAVPIDVPLVEAAARSGAPFMRKVPTTGVHDVLARADALAAGASSLSA